jgi:hypothetical protein
MSVASTFQVTLHDLPGHTITIPCTPNTPIATLIEQFREEAGIPSINKRQRITLTRKEGPLKRETLGENGIRNTITLMVAYHGDISCIDPEPIAPHVYKWIYQEKPILFYDPTRQEDVPMAALPMPRRLKTYHADTNLLAEYNGWTIGQEYLFFLTTAPPKVQSFFPLYRLEENEIVRYMPSVGPDFPLNITLYPQGIPSDSHETIGLRPFSSVRGMLHKIKLQMTIESATNDMEGYTFYYQFNVFLKGPIEIQDDRGMIIASVGEEAIGMIKYDQIVMCDPKGGLPDAVTNGASANGVAHANGANARPANRNQGGKRSRRSKNRKTRRTKRRV